MFFETVEALSPEGSAIRDVLCAEFQQIGLSLVSFFDFSIGGISMNTQNFLEVYRISVFNLDQRFAVLVHHFLVY